VSTRLDCIYMRNLHPIYTKRVGLALSGGSVRGLAHIGVYKVLEQSGVMPAIIAGTSAGSIIGAGIAAGMTWTELDDLARGIFWPTLLNGDALERFCGKYLPGTFSELRRPFAAVATSLPAKKPIAITTGNLASAISASCALRVIRGSVRRQGYVLKDGGIACVLPADVCRHMGAEFVIGSDVWEVSSMLRGLGLHSGDPNCQRFYPSHYRHSLCHTDLLVHPTVPLSGYWPSDTSARRVIDCGEQAAKRSLQRLPWASTSIA